jgi:hypothetical protein
MLCRVIPLAQQLAPGASIVGQRRKRQSSPKTNTHWLGKNNWTTKNSSYSHLKSYD